MGLQSFERRLEQLVEGSFGKAFRSGLEPVEIARRITRELDAQRSVGPRGITAAPNNIGVYLSPADFERFHSFADVLVQELAEVARAHARDEGYRFLGRVTVALVPDDELRPGDLDVAAEIHEGTRVGSVLLPDGRRVALGEDPILVGRTPECTITIADPRASRRHAEISPTGSTFVVTDLGSTNGTYVNDSPVRQQVLEDGDEIRIGNTVLVFETS